MQSKARQGNAVGWRKGGRAKGEFSFPFFFFSFSSANQGVGLDQGTRLLSICTTLRKKIRKEKIVLFSTL